MSKIVIVEDEIVLAKQLTDRIRSEGHDVTVKHSGEAGWNTIQEELPDLVILDIGLPELDGLSLCRLLRKTKATSHILAIMLTARGGEIDKIVGLENGADDYMVKPISLGELLARIKALLRRKHSHNVMRQDVLESGNISVNRSARKAFKGDNELSLSNKEFDLLAEFVLNRGVVLSRDLILSKVWGSDYFIDKRTVDVHVRWLREKIEEDSSNPHRIKTVRGVGYRFES